MSPCVAGNEKALNFNAINVKNLSVREQHFFVVNCHLRQLVEMINHLAASLSGEIAVFNLTDVQLRVPEQTGAVRFHRAYMVGVLMGDENVPDGCRVNAQPAHLFRQTVVIVACVEHDSGVTLAVEENVCYPLPHAGNIFIDPAGVQRLEDLLAPVHPAHCFSLEFRCLF